MTPRMRILGAFILALLLLCGLQLPTPAHAQSMPYAEPSNDAERALIAQHPNEWARMTPDQRQRVLENYRRWQRWAGQFLRQIRIGC